MTLYIDEIGIGMTARRARRLTRDCIAAFGDVSGDYNPVHFDDEYAESTPFGGVVAHGIHSAALISAVIGEELPGHGAIYLGQTLKFHGPVRPGDVVVAEVLVDDVDVAKRRLTLTCECRVDGKLVLSGEAKVLAPKRPAVARPEMAIAAE